MRVVRRKPVAFVLVDAGFLADRKWRDLRRRLSDARDFNSAVGTWLIALAAARRNGLPTIDVADEAEDPTFIEDLIAVGLLTDEGFPERPFSEWAPRRPVYPSDTAPTAPNAPNAPMSPPASPPLPSTLGSSLQDVVPAIGESLPRAPARAREEPGDAAVDVWFRLTGRWPTGNLLRWIDEQAKVHGGEVLSSALATCFAEDPSPKTLMSRAQALVERKDRKTAADERSDSEQVAFDRRVEQTKRRTAPAGKADIRPLRDILAEMKRDLPSARVGPTLSSSAEQQTGG